MVSLRKGSFSKNKSKERGKMLLRVNQCWFRWSFLLFCFVYLSGILPVGSTPIHVTGKKGGNATITCAFKGNTISEIRLKNKEYIDVCEIEECTGRVFRKGACDVIIRNLSFSDAGTYFLEVYYDDNQTVQYTEPSEYHLHIQDEISGKKGEELKLHVLWIDADKVERNSSGEWKEVWRRYRGVNSDRLTDHDGNLTIKAFIADDAGTYRVLDSKRETLITVTVTESSPEGSKGSLGDIEQPKPSTEPQGDLNSTAVETPVIVGVCLGVLVPLGVLGILVALVLYKFDVRTCQRRQRQMGGKTYEAAESHEMSQTGHQAQANTG